MCRRYLLFAIWLPSFAFYFNCCGAKYRLQHLTVSYWMSSFSVHNRSHVVANAFSCAANEFNVRIIINRWVQVNKIEIGSIDSITAAATMVGAKKVRTMKCDMLAAVLFSLAYSIKVRDNMTRTYFMILKLMPHNYILFSWIGWILCFFPSSFYIYSPIILKFL